MLVNAWAGAELDFLVTWHRSGGGEGGGGEGGGGGGGWSPSSPWICHGGG